jgi:uncharacterized protein
MVDDQSDVEVRASKIHRFGLYALRAFAPGEVVLSWDLSQTIANEEVTTLSEEVRHFTHPLNENRTLIVQPPARFVNHSCNNNTVVRDFCDVAIKPIAIGDEITSDYGADGSASGFACLCGSENCRGSVGKRLPQ